MSNFWGSLQLELELIDLGTKATGVFDIPQVMYSSIEECDIFIADLSGARHNVMVEVGYALKHVSEGHMVFYFQETKDVKSIPFDLGHLSCVIVKDSADIRTRVKENIITILNKVKTGSL